MNREKEMQARKIISSKFPLFQMLPDVKIGLTHDNTPSGEAYITFHTRMEAERAVTEISRKILRNHCVELMLAHPGLLSSAVLN